MTETGIEAITILLKPGQVRILDRIAQGRGKTPRLILEEAAAELVARYLETESLARVQVEEERRQELQKESKMWDWHSRPHTLEERDLSGRLRSSIDVEKRFFGKLLATWSPPFYGCDKLWRTFELFQDERGAFIVYRKTGEVAGPTTHTVFENVTPEDLGPRGQFAGLGGKVGFSRPAAQR